MAQGFSSRGFGVLVSGYKVEYKIPGLGLRVGPAPMPSDSYRALYIDVAI